MSLTSVSESVFDADFEPAVSVIRFIDLSGYAHGKKQKLARH